MGMSFWHLLLILLIVFVVFGAGKLPRVMGDIGRGVRSLRDGLKGEESADAASRPLQHSMKDATPSSPAEHDHSNR